MKRRDFIFRSLKASIILSPIFSIRQAEAQAQRKMKAFFYVDGASYPLPEDFFPAPTESLSNLAPILANYNDLRGDMVIIDGINIKNSGPNPRGNNHIRSVGKVLTAKDILNRSDDEDDGLPGGISIDQIIAQGLGSSSLEVMINNGERGDMRSRPFAVGPRQFKPPVASAADAWDRVFSNFQAPGGQAPDPKVKEQRVARLRDKKSLLDDLSAELKRFRVELVGVEKLKLDIHEDAIRKAELSVSAELNSELNNSPAIVTAQCSTPGRETSNDIPLRAKAHFDIMYTALLCDRIGVGGMIFGYSSVKWRYEWLNLGIGGNSHDDVFHKVATQRAKHVLATQWHFDQLAQFARKLKSTPDGSSNMLNNVLIYATSFFGKHHKLDQIPLLLIGNAQGRLRTGRAIKIASRPEAHAQVLTSAAALCGVNIAGIGDDPQSGPLSELA